MCFGLDRSYRKALTGFTLFVYLFCREGSTVYMKLVANISSRCVLSYKFSIKFVSLLDSTEVVVLNSSFMLGFV